jgi:hypothetical protein
VWKEQRKLSDDANLNCDCQENDCSRNCSLVGCRNLSGSYLIMAVSSCFKKMLFMERRYRPSLLPVEMQRVNAVEDMSRLRVVLGNKSQSSIIVLVGCHDLIWPFLIMNVDSFLKTLSSWCSCSQMPM